MLRNFEVGGRSNSLKINRQIRSSKIRLIDKDGKQVGVVSLDDGLRRAKTEGLDLVEVVSHANPPVCRIMNYGKYRYDQTKRDKESRKNVHQVKVKEVKFGLNIGEHDLQTKLRHAIDFLEKGHKVKVTVVFRGREMVHRDIGFKLIEKVCEMLGECSAPEGAPKMMGRFLTVMLAPVSKKKKGG